MFFKLLFMLLAAGSVVFGVWYVMIYSPLQVVDDTPNEPTGVDFPTPDVTEIPEPVINHSPNTIATTENQSTSDTPIVLHRDVKEIAPDFYQMTADTAQYDVSYDQVSGNLTITLYGEDTKKSRASAEAYILKTLPYTQDEWCGFVVTVITNEFENPTWAGRNLGLSFCPGSVAL
jgi:hypothetical protein